MRRNAGLALALAQVVRVIGDCADGQACPACHGFTPAVEGVEDIYAVRPGGGNDLGIRLDDLPAVLSCYRLSNPIEKACCDLGGMSVEVQNMNDPFECLSFGTTFCVAAPAKVLGKINCRGTGSRLLLFQ